eukprot:4707635-Ditylum_brightwellii.AAC.1
MIHWDNLQDGRMKLLSNTFVFLKLSFPNLVVVWHCGDLANNIPLYRLLCPPDVSAIKSGRQKLNMMHLLINAVYRAANCVNSPHLVVKDWTPHKYGDMKQLFGKHTIIYLLKGRVDYLVKHKRNNKWK